MAEQLLQDEPDPFDTGSTRSLPGPFQVVWRHKFLVLIGLLSALVLGVLYYSRARPLYQSTTQVLVVQKRPDFSLPGVEPRAGYTEDYLGTHQVLIRSPLIIGKAIAKGNLTALKSYAGQSDPTRAIIEQLKITREKETTNVLTLTFRGPVSEDCAVVLTAIVDSYKDFLDTTYRNVSEDTVKLITQAREVLETKLDEKEKEYRQFRLNHPGLMKGRDGTSVLQERLLSLESKRSALRLRQVELEGRLASFNKALKDGRSRAELMVMVTDSTRRLAGDAVKVSLKDDPVLDLELQEQKLLELYGPDHPEVRSLRNRLERYRTWNKQFGRQETALLDPVEAHLRFLKQELEDSRTEEQGLARLLESEQGEAKKLVNYEVQEEAFRTDIGRSQQLFDSIVKRLQEINIVKDLGGYDARSIAPAPHGGKVAPSILILVIACVLGLLCGLGLAYAAECTDHSFRTPEEIRQRLGLPVVGHIPFYEINEAVTTEDSSEVSPLDPMLPSFYSPRSREAESYRGVRTALYFSNRKGSQKVIQITSPDMGDGKTTLAANLVVSMAQSGKRVMLVDADFRRPRVHKLFGVPGERGLASVISEETELADVIQETAVPGLSLLPCGPQPPNPSELLSQPRLKELLDYLRDRYDFVVLDTPPLLAVTDPCVVVPHVDGVLLTLRIGKNTQPHAQRAKEILTTLGANVLGVVVNEADRNAASVYGYAGYRYGYGYAYRYDADDKSNSYYSDPPEGEGVESGGTATAQEEGQTGGLENGESKVISSAAGRRYKSRKGLLRRLWERF